MVLWVWGFALCWREDPVAALASEDARPPELRVAPFSGHTARDHAVFMWHHHMPPTVEADHVEGLKLFRNRYLCELHWGSLYSGSDMIRKVQDSLETLSCLHPSSFRPTSIGACLFLLLPHRVFASAPTWGPSPPPPPILLWTGVKVVNDRLVDAKFERVPHGPSPAWSEHNKRVLEMTLLLRKRHARGRLLDGEALSDSGLLQRAQESANKPLAINNGDCALRGCHEDRS